MPSKSELMTRLGLSASRLKSVLDAIGLPESAGFTEDEANLIAEYLSSKSSGTGQPPPDSDTNEVSVEGLDFSALQISQGVAAKKFQNRLRTSQAAGALQYVAAQAAQASGYSHAAALQAGLIKPESKEDVQILQALDAIEDVYNPVLPVGFTLEGCKLSLNVAAIASPRRTPELSGN